jgi:hypothetical protein
MLFAITLLVCVAAAIGARAVYLAAEDAAQRRAEQDMVRVRVRIRD